jgi:formate--tetrahydrofolate ligase
MEPIRDVAALLSIPEASRHYYGRHSAKLDLNLLNAPASGKLILVTAMTPTRHGEGKTVVSIGLSQAFWRTGRKAVVTLREPSLGPVFGLKGGATGGGRAQVIPPETINLHFNGDFHAVTAAHNLLAAIIDAHLHHSNRLGIDVDNIFWPRTLDMNDRALRNVIVGLGGKSNGIPRETGFVITAASEVMAILALAGSRAELKRRLSEIVVGLNADGQPVRTADLGATGAMMVLVHQAILPNLVATIEHTPALIHAGPFANIAHGTSSVLAQRMGLTLADYVINETGFGADLGLEKYMHIVMPTGGLKPSAAVVVVSIRALIEQGNGQLEAGFSNLDRHLENIARFGIPQVVAINRFPGDTPDQLNAVESHCRGLGVMAVATEAHARGGEGAVDLAEAVFEAARKQADPRVLYPPEMPLAEKVETVARQIYGAAGVYFESGSHKKLERYERLGFGSLPVCMAKTQYSFSDNPRVMGAPSGFTLKVTDVHLAAGAGYIVVVAGNLLRMPGLERNPQALHMDVDEDGAVIGLL